jgi:predicted ATPase/DNA-binding SARP family transcriptional activator
MSLLALYFLGSPRVCLDGASVKIDRRKVLALLVYLAVTAQRHSRDELTELLYGRHDRVHARANLRQTISLLRRAIGKDQLGADHLGVWLPFGKSLWIDVIEFRRLLKIGQTADTQGNLSAAMNHLTKAVGLFRGEFLSGFYLKDSTVFEDWQLVVQERLRREQASAFRRVVEIHEVWGQYEQAIDYGRRWLALDPLEEAVHRRLMFLYSLAGHHFEALRQYERCRVVLERELGEKPEEETELLHEQIDSRKLLQGTVMRPEHQKDSSTHLRAKPLPVIPLFLFAKITAAGEGQVIKQEGLLREAIGEERGRILTTAGQMLCAVFPTADAAIRAALSSQVRAGAISSGVRMVLLAGERVQRQVPSSILVERAEMLLDISHAGQILMNNTAAELASGAELTEGMILRCLGIHRLKDLGPPQPIHLLEQSNLQPGFEHLKTLDSRPNNLQTQPTRFIGREKELEAVKEILRLEEVQLLTLTGAGGVGKTRLALQAAAGLYERFEQGLFFVDLAALREPSQVIGAVAEALNVREAGGDGRSLFETLKDYLGNKQVLLLLDNVEHLLSAAAQIAGLLVSCPQLKVLATSREALHLQVERVYRVPPMQLPAQGQRLEVMKRCEAVRLFNERATAVLSTFELSKDNVEVVAEICIRLDGLPLAIELAVTRIRVLTPQTLLTKLKNRLNLLKGGPHDLPERQQTLRSEIDWSHELLEPEERLIFMRLSVFPAGCTLDAAEAVCCMAGEDLDVFSNLSSLAEKSLIRLVEGSWESRFRMLETIREYAREKLEGNGELEALEPRFATHFIRFAEQAEPELYGPNQIQWFNRIEDEYGNIRAALAWLYERRELEDGLRLAGALGWFWFRRARFTEGQYWLELFRTAACEVELPGLRAKAAYFLGWLKLCVGSAFWGNPEGKHFFKESLGLWRGTGNQRGIALSQVWLGWKDDIEGEEGWSFADESVAIARKTGDPWTIAWCLKVAYSYLRRQDKDLAYRRSALEEAIALARKTEDPFLLSQAMNGMGNVFAWVGDLETAEPWYLKSLSIAREIDDSWSILDNINCLADGCLGLGQIRKAKEMFTEGLRLAMDLGARAYLAWFIGGLYGVARHEGRSKRAVRLGAFSESILNPDSPYDPSFAEELGLDSEVAAVQWKIGQNMTPGEAVAYALTDG